MGKIKGYFCKTEGCGALDPSLFYPRYKSICIKCHNTLSKLNRETKDTSEYNKKYYIEHKEEKSFYYKLYNKENRKSISVKQKKYQQDRRNSDLSFRIVGNLRSRQNQVLKGKSSTTNGLGCDSSFLRYYIESLWEPWMNWDNYGKKEGQWSIDHIIPISSFEKDGEGNWDANSEYNKKLIHYTNLKPLLHKENIEKYNKIIAF
jgi:hypothetical protein